MTTTLISTDGTKTVVKPENPKKGFTLKELQKHVGGYIEYVRLSGNRKLIVNEEGFINDLPVNEEATKLVDKTQVMLADGTIRGNVLLQEPEPRKRKTPQEVQSGKFATAANATKNA